MVHDACLEKGEIIPTFHVLLVEDNQGDILLIKEAIKENGLIVDLKVVMDGEEAMHYLLKQKPYTYAKRPDLILLDLNLPKKDGRYVLSSIKNDTNLKAIPVLILTISQADEDIKQCYEMQANCYIKKPFEIEKFIQLFRLISQFWFEAVALPVNKDNA